MNLDDLSSLLPVPDIELPAPHERARLRKRFGVTQSRLAQALNVTRKTIGTWEAGKGEPTGTNRAQYATVLHAWTETEKGQRQ